MRQNWKVTAYTGRSRSVVILRDMTFEEVNRIVESRLVGSAGRVSYTIAGA